MTDRVALARAITDDVKKKQTEAVAGIYRLGQAVSEIVQSATPYKQGVWGDMILVNELEVLLPMIERAFYGDLAFSVNEEMLTLDSRPMSDLEVDGANHVLADRLGCDFHDVPEEWFVSLPGIDKILLRLTAKNVTDLLFVEADRT